MEELMDFYEAYREVAGTERGVRYKNYNWCKFRGIRD
jgi:hypothetical protein